MNKKSWVSFLSIVLILVSISTACSTVKTFPPTSVRTTAPTGTQLPPTATLFPTATFMPTATPNLAATQAYDDFYAQLTDYKDKGYFTSLDGSQVLLHDFSENWPQINWYQWWPSENEVTNFIYSGHFKWSVAIQTPEDSGCGVAFAIQDDGSNYTFFLDKSRIIALHYIASMNRSKEVGKTRGSGRVNISNPYEADFSLASNGNHVYVYVNKTFIGEYTLSVDSNMKGKFGYTLLSGTNKDYGTQCEITDGRLWVLNN
jgi:hypothetical protein